MHTPKVMITNYPCVPEDEQHLLADFTMDEALALISKMHYRLISANPPTTVKSVNLSIKGRFADAQFSYYPAVTGLEEHSCRLGDISDPTGMVRFLLAELFTISVFYFPSGNSPYGVLNAVRAEAGINLGQIFKVKEAAITATHDCTVNFDKKDQLSKRVPATSCLEGISLMMDGKLFTDLRFSRSGVFSDTFNGELTARRKLVAALSELWIDTVLIKLRADPNYGYIAD